MGLRQSVCLKIVKMSCHFNVTLIKISHIYLLLKNF